MDLNVKGFIELKIAYRNLIKKPIRTLFTFIAIILGVSIFFSVNVATDSLEHSLYAYLDPSIYGDVDQWVYLFRGVLMVISAISLIISVIIIKNLMEMSKEDQIYELGLLRALGTSKISIFLIFFYQVLILASIGVIIGIILGFFMSASFFGPLKTILSNFLILSTDFEVQLFYTPLTLISGISVGLIVPVIFGTIPAISAAKINILYALNPQTRPRRLNLQSLSFRIIQVIMSISLIIIGIIILNVGFAGLLSFSTDTTMETSFAIVLLFFAGLIFISGSILFGSILLSYISYIFSHILSPILLKMKKICYRNIVKNLRRTKNTFLMIAIGLSFLITVNITLDSIQSGVLPGAHMRIGGDIRLGMYYSSDQTRIPLNTSSKIREIPHVKEICEVKNSYWFENFATCDSFGTKTGENLIIFVINTTSYVQMHYSSSFYQYQGEKSFFDFIHQLDINGTVILQRELATSIQKTENQVVNISTEYSYNFFPILSSNLTITGIMDVLPGILFTWGNPDPDSKEYVAVISWNTYFNITGSKYTETTGYFWINCENPNQADDVREDIKNLYQTLGSPWNITNFENTWQIRTVLDDITKIREILNLVYIILVSILLMALIISMLGLATTMIMNVNKRINEIGLLRSFGVSKFQILQLVFGETLIIGMSASIIGTIIGIITGFILCQVPFMPYVLIIFTLKWENIINFSIIMVFLCFISSILPAIKANRFDIINAIRKKGL